MYYVIIIMLSWIKFEFSMWNTVYREYSSPFYFPPFHPHCDRENLRLGQIQYLILSLIKNNCVKGNLKQGETFCKCRRTKITWVKITLYTFIFFLFDSSYKHHSKQWGNRKQSSSGRSTEEFSTPVKLFWPDLVMDQ